MAQVVEERWLPLGRASQLLGVTQTSLRQWTDQGLVRTFRTPGGHRRLLRDDLIALTKAKGEQAGARDWSAEALVYIRRRMHHPSTAEASTLHSFDEEARVRMRVLGRRLLTLAAEYVAQRRKRAELEEEALFLGQEYGRELAQQRLKLSQAIAAFHDFRVMLYEAMTRSMGAGVRGPERERMWNRVVGLEDRVLEGIARSYEARSAPVQKSRKAR